MSKRYTGMAAVLAVSMECHALSASTAIGQPATRAITRGYLLSLSVWNLHALDVTLGDTCNWTGKGVTADEVAGWKRRRCKLHDVLYVPKLSYNLLSVSRAADKSDCQIRDAKQ